MTLDEEIKKEHGVLSPSETLSALPIVPKCLVCTNEIVAEKAMHDYSVYYCISCETPYHIPCHAYAGQCSILGCGERAVYLSSSITADKSENKAMAARPVQLPTESTAPQTVSDLCALDDDDLSTEVDLLIKKYRVVSKCFDWVDEKSDGGHSEAAIEERYGNTLSRAAKITTANFLRCYVGALDYCGESVPGCIVAGAIFGATIGGVIKLLLYTFDVPYYDWNIVSSFLAAGSVISGIGSIALNTHIGTPEYEKEKAEKLKQLKKQYQTDMKLLLG